MKNPAAYKPISTATSNFTASGPKAAQNYKQAVNNQNTDWATAAASDTAQSAMQAGLTAAMAEGRVKAGINRVGNDKWRKNSINKGAPALSAQIGSSGNAYNQGMTTVYGDMQNAHSAYEAAYKANGGGYAGREAGGLAYRNVLHAAAEARKAAGGR